MTRPALPAPTRSIALSLALLIVSGSTTLRSQASPGASVQAAEARDPAAAKGVQCPADFESLYDPTTKVLRCRRDIVRWVVTSCADKAFATYVARPGADSCNPTEIPGVGAPPGSSGSRPVACASSGYTIVVDRTGARDRCERVDRVFVLPRVAP